MSPTETKLHELILDLGYRKPVGPMPVIQSLNAEVDLVIDVGIRRGTPFLYKTFPDTPFLLVDPQKGGEDLMKYRPKNYEFVNLALGSKRGILELHEEGGRSSFLERTALTKGKVEESYNVEVITLDDLIDRKVTEGSRLGIKIDTEGYELEVLRGLNKHLDLVEFIICEASVKDRFEDSYTFADLITAADERGFRMYTILNDVRVPVRKFYDVVFLQKTNRLFAHQK